MSTFAKFTKDMEIGVAKIDEQHKELINKINELIAMGSKAFSKEETEKTLDMLGKYVVQHFADEEELQQEYGYPKYEIHKKQHQDFVKQFLKMKEEFQEKGTSAKFMMNLIVFVSNWVINHVKGSDVEIGKHYRKQQDNQSK